MYRIICHTAWSLCFLLLITAHAYSALLFSVIAGNHLRDNWYGWAAFLTAFVKLERSDGIKAHAHVRMPLQPLI